MGNLFVSEEEKQIKKIEKIMNMSDEERINLFAMDYIKSVKICNVADISKINKLHHLLLYLVKDLVEPRGDNRIKTGIECYSLDDQEDHKVTIWHNDINEMIYPPYSPWSDCWIQSIVLHNIVFNAIMLNDGKNEVKKDGYYIYVNLYDIDCIEVNKKIRKYALSEIEILKKAKNTNDLETIEKLNHLIEIMEYDTSNTQNKVEKSSHLIDIMDYDTSNTKAQKRKMK